jgi:hypothetical protein
MSRKRSEMRSQGSWSTSHSDRSTESDESTFYDQPLILLTPRGVARTRMAQLVEQLYLGNDVQGTDRPQSG